MDDDDDRLTDDERGDEGMQIGKKISMMGFQGFVAFLEGGVDEHDLCMLRHILNDSVRICMT